MTHAGKMTHLGIARVWTITGIPVPLLAPGAAGDKTCNARRILCAATTTRRPREDGVWVDLLAMLRTFPLLHGGRLNRVVCVLVTKPVRFRPTSNLHHTWPVRAVLCGALRRTHVTAAFTRDEATAWGTRMKDLAGTRCVVPVLSKQLWQCDNIHAFASRCGAEIRSNCPYLCDIGP